MQLKDYYKTLDLTPLASSFQIKKSFRRLALQYHPDKNPGNAIAAAKFREIREAYETLSDPSRREDYNYRRWHLKTLRKDYTRELTSGDAILAASRRLREYVQSSNVFNLDKDALSHHIRQLLSEQHLDILAQENNLQVNNRLLEQIIPVASHLPLAYAEPIGKLLYTVAGTDEGMHNLVRRFLDERRKHHRWSRYRTLIVIGATILLCLVIYWVSR